MLKINFFDEANGPKECLKVLKTVLKRAAKDQKLRGKNVISVILVTNEKIRELNNTYRKMDRPTDVLSFPDNETKGELGDIFISYEKALWQAEEYGHSFDRELAFLSLHGFLHCLGYDHQNEKEEKEMLDLQRKILENTKYKR